MHGRSLGAGRVDFNLRPMTGTNVLKNPGNGKFRPGWPPSLCVEMKPAFQPSKPLLRPGFLSNAETRRGRRRTTSIRRGDHPSVRGRGKSGGPQPIEPLGWGEFVRHREIRRHGRGFQIGQRQPRDVRGEQFAELDGVSLAGAGREAQLKFPRDDFGGVNV